jgi:Tfp pilus assembly major pilin PilA
LQATPGKLLLRIHVTDLAGRRIGFGRATGRHFARILSSLIFYVGYLMAAFTWRRQALHDMLAGTLVVQGNVTAPRAAHDAASTAPGNATAVGPAPPRHAARNAGATPAIVVATCVAALFLTGILAAIAIPAYQTYAIRAQVAEGLQLAEAPEQAIRAALIAGENPLQIDQDSLRLGELAASRYVEFVRVTAGSVVIRYGSRSNRAIAGEFLVIAPARNDVNEFSWLCGRRLAPEGWEPLVPAAARYTTIADKYLPARCRR